LLLSAPAYFIFLAAIFAVYWPLSRVRILALSVILFGDYFFYAKWDLYLLALMPAAASCDYVLGLGLQYSNRPLVRRILILASLALNIGLLVYARQNLSISLSFYAFQALTYTIDLYRRDAKGTRSYLAHLGAVSFFPTTLAGPITRVQSLIDQFERPKQLLGPDGGRALFLIGMGLVKKLMIADYLALNLVNRVFDFPALYSGAETLVAVYGYALQLYYDFSGYTDIAMGSALLLGIKLPQNFNMPYAAENVADFWRRWHITLSNWLRDYLYFSLPGKRWKPAVYINLVITFAIGGLWHGASLNFLIWGLLHGTGLAVVRGWQTLRGNQPAAGVWRFVNIFVTLHFVCFAWIFFRASNVDNAIGVLSRIASLTTGLPNISGGLALILGIAAVAHYVPKKAYDFTVTLYARTPFFVQAALLAALVIGLRYLAQTGATPFIYNRF
jgi:alginate O-acetyltransferase complex protein AlgI